MLFWRRRSWCRFLGKSVVLLCMPQSRALHVAESVVGAWFCVFGDRSLCRFVWSQFPRSISYHFCATFWSIILVYSFAFCCLVFSRISLKVESFQGPEASALCCNSFLFGFRQYYHSSLLSAFSFLLVCSELSNNQNREREAFGIGHGNRLKLWYHVVKVL